MVNPGECNQYKIELDKTNNALKNIEVITKKMQETINKNSTTSANVDELIMNHNEFLNELNSQLSRVKNIGGKGRGAKRSLRS